MSISTKKSIDILPDDDELFLRTKKWSNLFEKFNKDESDEDGYHISHYVDDKHENENENDDEESISVTEFEDKGIQDDPNFNVQDVFNNTMKLVAKRKENWHKSGVDKFMDSFSMDKVGDWLKNRCCSGPLSCIDEVEFQDRQLYVENASDNESLQSVDTAKYILSNRNNRKARVRTMTIKRFCFSRKRMEEVEQEGKRKKSPLMILDNRLSECGNRKHFLGKNRKRNHRCTTSFSSTSSSSPNYLLDSRSEHAGRNYRNIKNRKRCKIRKSRSKVKRLAQSETDSPISSKSNNDFIASESCFCPENLVNSTELSEKNIQVVNNNAKLGKITDKIVHLTEETSRLISSSNGISNDKSKSIYSTPPPIVIYTPENSESSLNVSKSIVKGKLVITKKILEETIGPELAKIYLGEKKEVSHSFDMQSTVLFYPPEKHTDTSDSEVDVIETLSANMRGRIVEVPITSE